MVDLKAILQPERLTSVVDVGAAAIDGPPPYQAMLNDGLCTVAAFEPQTKLWGPETDLLKWYPDVIGDGLPAVLYECAAPGMTSLFAPDPASLACFPGMSMWGKVRSTRHVTTKLLDNMPGLAPIDFLKIDAQGSELAILQGAQGHLRNILFVQAEVHFFPLYRHQPMFRDIDDMMNRNGFVFHCFADISSRGIEPYPHQSPYNGINQIQGADAVYVRDFRHMDALSVEQLKHMAILAHYCYDSHDLAYRCVEELGRRKEIPGRQRAMANEYVRKHLETRP